MNLFMNLKNDETQLLKYFITNYILLLTNHVSISYHALMTSGLTLTLFKLRFTLSCHIFFL